MHSWSAASPCTLAKSSAVHTIWLTGNLLLLSKMTDYRNSQIWSIRHSCLRNLVKTSWNHVEQHLQEAWIMGDWEAWYSHRHMTCVAFGAFWRLGSCCLISIRDPSTILGSLPNDLEKTWNLGDWTVCPTYFVHSKKQRRCDVSYLLYV